MGNLRSKTGCRTCRNRRVKCDEVKPVCGPCAKKNRSCQYDSPQLEIRQFQPGDSSTSRTQLGVDDGLLDGGGDVEEGGDSRQNGTQFLARAPDGVDHPTNQAPSLLTNIPPAQQSRSQGLLPVSSTEQQLTRYEALLIRHYVENLGPWLDCSDALRRFTLSVPQLVRHCPVLLYAVLSFAARHRGDKTTSEQAYQRCLGLVIDRLDEQDVASDDGLLCAIVILRIIEQLSVAITGSDFEQHLAGCAAILRASQGQLIDPSAPTTHDAAFFVHVRQCLYTASVNQQPPNLDLSLRLADIIAIDLSSDQATVLRNETAWANSMTWLCASVEYFAFGGSVNGEAASRLRRWSDLGDALSRWRTERPRTFDPIWSGPATETSVFPEVWFATDLHAVAYSYHHFTSLLLINCRPMPKLAVPDLDDTLTEQDLQVLNHARAICGASMSSRSNVGNLIVLCHTVFIWGPVMTEARERSCVLQLLFNFERDHIWPTAWIIQALKKDWRIFD